MKNGAVSAFVTSTYTSYTSPTTSTTACKTLVASIFIKRNEAISVSAGSGWSAWGSAFQTADLGGWGQHAQLFVSTSTQTAAATNFNWSTLSLLSFYTFEVNNI